MADSTKLPILGTDLTYFKWTLPDAPNPRLASPISTKTEQTIYFTSAPKDHTGAVITTPFLMSVKNKSSYVETIYCPNGADGADGKSATGCIRGIDPDGLDYTAGDSDFADTHEADSPVACNIPAVWVHMLMSAMQGVIATGGDDLIIGTDALGTVTVSRSTGTGTYVGWLRWNTSTSQGQYSNDGSSWTNFDDSISSALVKVSSNDTTPGYLNGKLVAGTNVTLTENNDGSNETLTIAASSQREGITTHLTYTPGYLTGDTGAQSLWNLWVVVTDGSFRVTVDGVAVNVDAIDFSSVTSMATVASTIQTALNTATGGTETVVWSTDHFIITSTDTTSASGVSVLSTSTGTVGTDISGAGASDWMDADVGNGVVTAAVRDDTADVGKVGLLDASGVFSNELTPDILYDDATTVTKTALTEVTDKSVDAIVHNHNVLTTEFRKPTDGSGASGRIDYIEALSLPDAADTAANVGIWYRPTGYNISSVKLYLYNTSGGAINGNAYMSYKGHSWAIGGGAVTEDVVGAAAVAYSADDNAIGAITVPATSYASWGEGEYFELYFVREATNILDTLGQNVYAVIAEVIYTLA